jgi:hypothetical protein
MSAVLRCLTVSPSTAAKPTDAAAAAAAKKHSSQQAVTDSLRSCHRFALAFNLGKACKQHQDAAGNARCVACVSE